MSISNNCSPTDWTEEEKACNNKECNSYNVSLPMLGLERLNITSIDDVEILLNH
jgi:hypothetical protein